MFTILSKCEKIQTAGKETTGAGARRGLKCRSGQIPRREQWFPASSRWGELFLLLTAVLSFVTVPALGHACAWGECRWWSAGTALAEGQSELGNASELRKRYLCTAAVKRGICRQPPGPGRRRRTWSTMAATMTKLWLLPEPTPKAHFCALAQFSVNCTNRLSWHAFNCVCQRW